jgi:hypothetical protein
VAAYLRERTVPFFRSLNLAGRSGFHHHFDFGFSSVGDRPEAVLQAANALTRDWATSVAFAVNDVRLQRGDAAFVAYAMINDRESAPALDHLDALRAYGIKTFLWSQREALAGELGAN